jgi:hypothetical protein
MCVCVFSMLSIDVLAAAHALASTSFGSSSPSSYTLDLFSFVCKMLGTEKETNMFSPSSHGPMEVVDEEGIATAPSKTAYLLISRVQGAGAGVIADVEGASKVEGCAEEGASKSFAIMDGSVDIGLGVNDLFDLDWQPCNSFSTNISSLSVIALIKSQISL